jgi:hypothetical protein
MVPASDPVTTTLYAHRRLREPRSGSHLTFQNLAAQSRAATPQVPSSGAGAGLVRPASSHLPTEY